MAVAARLQRIDAAGQAQLTCARDRWPRGRRGRHVGYGWLLWRFTDAYAPFIDSIILAFSVLGQLLLMDRRVESWWCWLLVNTIAVPLYASRGLNVTAVLYAAFWINAVVSLRHWQRLAGEVTEGERGDRCARVRKVH